MAGVPGVPGVQVYLVYSNLLVHGLLPLILLVFLNTAIYKEVQWGLQNTTITDIFVHFVEASENISAWLNKHFGKTSDYQSSTFQISKEFAEFVIPQNQVD